MHRLQTLTVFQVMDMYFTKKNSLTDSYSNFVFHVQREDAKDVETIEVLAFNLPEAMLLVAHRTKGYHPECISIQLLGVQRIVT